MKERKGAGGEPIWDIEATIICERDSHKGIIIGKGGAMLKKIGSAARYEIEHMMEQKRKHYEHLKKKDPELAQKLKNFYNLSGDDK